MVFLGSCVFHFFLFLSHSLASFCRCLVFPCVSASEYELPNASPPSPQNNLFQRVQFKPSPSFASILCVSRLRRKTLLISQSVDHLPLSQLNISFCPILIIWRIGGILQDCGVPKFTSSAWIVVLYLRDSSERRRYLVGNQGPCLSSCLITWLVLNK